MNQAGNTSERDDALWKRVSLGAWCDTNDVESRRQSTLFHAYSFIGFTFLFVFTVAMVVRENTLLVITYLTGGTLLFINVVILRHTLRLDWANMAGSVIGALFIFSVILIDHDKPSVYFWALFFTVIPFSVTGLKRGLIVILPFVAAVLFVAMYSTHNSMASDNIDELFSGRLLGVLLGLAFTAYFFEYYRSEAYTDLKQEFTMRKQAEELTRTLYQAIEQSPVSVLITNSDGNIEYVNSTFVMCTGYSSEEVMGQNTRILKSGKTPDLCYQELWQAISNGQAWEGEFQSRKKSGETFWEHAHIAPVLDEAGDIRHYLAVKEDVTLRKQQEERILHQAHFDVLTDLPNRFLALDRLSQLLNEAQRNKDLAAVMFLDLDDFKKINDTLGHDIGDKLLIEAATRLRSVARSADTVGRLGGDEFIVLLGGLSDANDARPVAENLLNRFRDPFRIDGRELVLTISVGIAIYPDDGTSSAELLRSADSAMYHSKEQGRNVYHFFTNAMNQDVARRLQVEEQLRGALERGELYLCYQPLVNVVTCTIVGVEALLRWNNPALGKVSPDEFIPIAEQSGLIIPIGRYVLNQALSMEAKWQQKCESQFTMAINLSPCQFRDLDLVAFVEDAMGQSGVSGESLTLEITEGVLMSGHTYIDDALAALSELGVSIAMDDFGTGYSSLSYLRSYPFNTLKIDRSFINDIIANPADRELVNATIAMAHGLGLKVVAEGVETEEQLAFLAAQSCDFAQGYLFSKPVSADEITEMLETGS